MRDFQYKEKTEAMSLEQKAVLGANLLCSPTGSTGQQQDLAMPRYWVIGKKAKMQLVYDAAAASIDPLPDAFSYALGIGFSSASGVGPSNLLRGSADMDVEVFPNLLNTALSSFSDVGRALARNLGRVDCVEAVFVVNDDGVVCSYAVVNDFDPDVVERVMEAEERVERLHSTTLMDFRIRASQGREPHTVVPINATPVWLK